MNPTLTNTMTKHDNRLNRLAAIVIELINAIGRDQQYD